MAPQIEDKSLDLMFFTLETNRITLTELEEYVLNRLFLVIYTFVNLNDSRSCLQIKHKMHNEMI